MIEDDELEDFRAAITDAGYDLADFEVEGEEEQPGGWGVRLNVEWRKVTRLSNKCQKTYDYTSWVTEFADDLQRGIFGEEPA